MKLITKEIEKALESHPLYSQEGNPNPQVVVKFFNPCGAGSWYITEGEKQANGDWLLFGLCYIQEAELGYVMLSDLESIRLPFGLTIERDLYWSGTLNDAYKDLGIDNPNKKNKDEEDSDKIKDEILGSEREWASYFR